MLAVSTEDCRYPLEVIPDVGIDPRKAGSRAAVAERCQTNQRPAAVNIVRQRTTAVALYNAQTTHIAHMISCNSHTHGSTFI